MELKLYDVKVHINVANQSINQSLPHLLLQYLFYYILIRNLVKEMKVKLFIQPARLVKYFIGRAKIFNCKLECCD